MGRGAALIAAWAAMAVGDTGGTNAVRVVTDEILVTARGRATAASKTPGSVGVIDTADAADRSAASIPDLFRLVPGVDRTADGAWGSEASIRGLSRESVVMMIDGSRVNTATDLGARLGLVDPAEIERVEILKGPISSLYGSGSIGGVVNVITRSGHFAPQDELHGGVSGTWEDNPQGFNLFGFGEADGPSCFLYGSQTYRDHDSYVDGDGNEVRNSQYSDSSTRVRGGYLLGSGHRLDLNVEYFEGRDIGIPGTGNAPLPATADVTYEKASRQLLSVRDTWNPAGLALRSSTLDVYCQRITREVSIVNLPASNPARALYPSADHDTYGAKWINVLELGEHGITVGADAWERLYSGIRYKYLRSGAVKVDQPLPDATYGSAGVFVEDDWNVTASAGLNAGGRVDAIAVENDATAVWAEGDENDVSWDVHAGGTWNLTRALNMKLIGASGYRAASLEERFQYLDLGGGIVKVGNPELDPERSLFAEYSVNWYGDRVYWSVAAYVNALEDMIGESFVSATEIVNANVDEARIQGVEADLRWDVAAAVHLYGNLAYADGRDTKHDTSLAGIAPFGGMAGIAYGEEQGGWARLETVFAARQDNVPEGVSEAPAWTTVDARVGWKRLTGTTRHNVYAGVDNLFDEAYRNYLTTYRGNAFNEPGRSYVAGYELIF